MAKELETALETLREAGFKQTQRRSDLLTFMIETNKYSSAKEIYDFMEGNYPGISYDTIYRNLSDFATLNLVEETEFSGEKKYRFQCDQHEIGHHHHFICTSCGATKEIHMCPMDYFQQQLQGCKIESHRFEIFGKCENCQ